MATGVKVTISARDNASNALERINARIARMQAPVRRTQAALARFSSLTGLNRLSDGFARVTRSAMNSYRVIGQIIPPLSTITSVASIAGVFSMARAWGQMGTNLRTSARAIGMSPARLKTLQNATDLAGGSAEAMTGALEGLSETQWRVLNGFAPAARAQFQAWGITIQDLQKMKPEEIFDRIAQKLRGIRNPAARTIAAMQIFGGAAQGLLPIFQQTEKEWLANVAAGEKNAGMTNRNVEAAVNAERAYRSLTQAADSFRYEIAQDLSPAIMSVLQIMRDLVVSGRVWINQNLPGYVKQISTWLRNGGWAQIRKDILSVGGAINDVAQLIERLNASPAFQKIMDKVGAIAGLSGAGPSLSPGALEAQRQLAARQPHSAGPLGSIRNSHFRSDPIFYRDYQFLRQLGLTSSQASGVVASEYAESSGNERAVNGSHFGLFQWDSERQANYAATHGGRSILDATHQQQLQFAVDELRTTRQGAGRRVLSATTAADAGHDFSYYDEVPYADEARREAESQRRATIANQFYERFGNNDRYGSNWVARDLHQGLYDLKDMVSSGPQKLRVEVAHTNAPPGSSVRVTGTSPGLTVHSVSQQRAMDPINTSTGN